MAFPFEGWRIHQPERAKLPDLRNYSEEQAGRTLGPSRGPLPGTAPPHNAQVPRETHASTQDGLCPTRPPPTARCCGSVPWRAVDCGPGSVSRAEDRVSGLWQQPRACRDQPGSRRCPALWGSTRAGLGGAGWCGGSAPKSGSDWPGSGASGRPPGHCHQHEAVVVSVGADELGEHLRVTGIRSPERVWRSRERDPARGSIASTLLTGLDERQDPRAPVGLDADHHRAGPSQEAPTSSCGGVAPSMPSDRRLAARWVPASLQRWMSRWASGQSSPRKIGSWPSLDGQGTNPEIPDAASWISARSTAPRRCFPQPPPARARSEPGDQVSGHESTHWPGGSEPPPIGPGRLPSGGHGSVGEALAIELSSTAPPLRRIPGSPGRPDLRRGLPP